MRLSDVGTSKGYADGASVGSSDGIVDGPAVGVAVVVDFDGATVGLLVGFAFRVGTEDGINVGFLVGICVVGLKDGRGVGPGVLLDGLREAT